METNTAKFGERTSTSTRSDVETMDTSKDDPNVIRAEAQEIATQIGNQPDFSSVSYSFNDCDSSISFMDLFTQPPLPICESTMVLETEDSRSILPESETVTKT